MAEPVDVILPVLQKIQAEISANEKSAAERHRILEERIVALEKQFAELAGQK
jgi:hypothetical protein